MDVLRSGYRTKCRFHQGSDQEEEIVWYRADPDADLFPFSHAFGSTVWEGDHRDTFQGPGEVGRERTWSPSVGPLNDGKHFHGDPAWFKDGIPSNPGPPPEVVCGARDFDLRVVVQFNAEVVPPEEFALGVLVDFGAEVE